MCDHLQIGPRTLAVHSPSPIFSFTHCPHPQQGAPAVEARINSVQAFAVWSEDVAVWHGCSRRDWSYLASGGVLRRGRRSKFMRGRVCLPTLVPSEFRSATCAKHVSKATLQCTEPHRFRRKLANDMRKVAHIHIRVAQFSSTHHHHHHHVYLLNTQVQMHGNSQYHVEQE